MLGGPRTGRDHTVKDPDPGKAFPGGEIYLSFPGLGDRLAARVAAEIGDHIEQFDTPNSLQSYAGKAPVTRRSGKSELVVSCRLACNRYLRDAVQQWAFCSLNEIGLGPRVLRRRSELRGKGHHAALRALGNRWLEVLWHCVTKRDVLTKRRSTWPTESDSSQLPEGVVDKRCLISRTPRSRREVWHTDRKSAPAGLGTLYFSLPVVQNGLLTCGS